LRREITRHVEEGKLKAMPLMQSHGAVEMTLPDAFSDDALLNLNTPEDPDALRETPAGSQTVSDFTLQENR